MHGFVRWVVVVCAVVAPLVAEAQALVIGGGVFEDRTALATRAGFVPRAGVTVKLYQDGGDRTPSAGDAAIATAKTDAGGMYVFRVPPGDYWVVVDSKTFGENGTWPEQTFGPAGSLCARPDGTPRAIYFEGACTAGRTLNSDDASSLATAEHLALVSLRENATSVDFAFSFDVVTSVNDGEQVQGSLRQFIVNANAVAGPNRMRFVPLVTAPEQRDPTVGVPARWWVITMTSPLPELRDADTMIDGTAYNFLSPATQSNVHPGRYGEPATIQPTERERLIPRLDKPELEVRLNGSEGIACAARCGIHAVALHGTATTLALRADARIEHVLVGAAPDGEPTPDFGTVGVQVEHGATAARQLLVTNQRTAGIAVVNDAHLEGEHLDVSRCGAPTTGGGVILLSNGSSIRSSNIAANQGAGIVIGSPDGATPANGNTIDGCTISGNQAGVLLGPGSSRNVITRNDLMWNRLGGVTSAQSAAAPAPPRENRISANRFDENGLRPIVLDLDAANPNELQRGTGSCTPVATAANAGISAPVITSVRMEEEGAATARVIVRGRACPGQVVEIYQSYVTSGVREEQTADLPEIRNDRVEARETVTNQNREISLPSIGEFNYVGATNTAADGTFEATFPIALTTETPENPNAALEETNIWAREVLPGSRAADRAFSGIAIDASGNTSEMSVRRQVD